MSSFICLNCRTFQLKPLIPGKSISDHHDHSKDKNPRLILVSGLPGTGKTFFADALSDALEADHYNSDRIRCKMDLRGKYDQASKEKVYTELLDKTYESLEEGHTVVVDATLYLDQLREPFIELAEQLEVPLFWMEIHASERIIRQRVEKARPWSEADFEVYKKIKATYEPLNFKHLVLESGEKSIEEMLESAILYLDQSYLPSSSSSYSGSK